MASNIQEHNKQRVPDKVSGILSCVRVRVPGVMFNYIAYCFQALRKGPCESRLGSLTGSLGSPLVKVIIFSRYHGLFTFVRLPTTISPGGQLAPKRPIYVCA